MIKEGKGKNCILDHLEIISKRIYMAQTSYPGRVLGTSKSV
jgi:hypothetical protein